MRRRGKAEASPHQGPAWFAPKRIGYGSGWPIAWQGWALVVAYPVLVLALTPLARTSVLAHVSLTVTVSAIFLLIARKTTPGGWRWRSGKEKER
jgi:hypothetical protein